MRIIRLPAVLEKTGISESRVYQLMRSGSFPESVELGPNSVGWYETEVDEWLAARPRRRSRIHGQDLPQASVPQS